MFAKDTTGTKIWEATYLPFGGVQASSGPNPELRFPGQWFQSETGLHQNWMRDYDPTLGRYLQADPLGLVDGPSVYGYALQNPGRYVDPRGEESLTPFILPISPTELGPFWVPQQHPSNPHPTFVRFCDASQFLQFNQGKSGAGGNLGTDHWHYFIGGLKSGNKQGFPPSGPNFGGGNHLPPGFEIMVTDCSCGGDGVFIPVPLPFPKMSPLPRNRGGGTNPFVFPIPQYLH